MMIKISSVENVYGDVWDHMGKSNLVQIFISYEDFGIYFVRFVYDEGGKLVLSERPAGTKLGSKFHTIKLNYKEEFLTSLAGTYRRSSVIGSEYIITSLSFGTNRVNHGPFGSPGREDKKFDFQLGQDRALGGFHGTTGSGVLQSIGVYVKPLTSSTSSITI